MKLQEPQQIIIDFLGLMSEEAITYYELEKSSKRHYSTTRSYVAFLEMLGLVKIHKIVNGNYIKYEITLTEDGLKVKRSISKNRSYLNI